MPKRTTDLVALILAGVVGVVVIATTVAILFLSLTHPERDVTGAADAIGRILGVLIGALTGYVAGRRINGGSE